MLSCTTKGFNEIRTGDTLLLRRILTVYRFRRETKAFVLAGAPATFSKVMDAVLIDLRYVEC